MKSVIFTIANSGVNRKVVMRKNGTTDNKNVRGCPKKTKFAHTAKINAVIRSAAERKCITMLTFEDLINICAIKRAKINVVNTNIQKMQKWSV